MARGSGSAWLDKRTGKLWASVSVSARRRLAKPCPLAVDLDEARQRAGIAAELVNALRDAHRDTPALLETTVEEVARVPLDKLDDVRAMVAAVLGGTVPIAGEASASKGKPAARSFGRPATFGGAIRTSSRKCQRHTRPT
jgi:hypothetical protein